MRTVDIQNSLVSGELSPLLSMRDDYDRYKNGVKTMLNFVPIAHGGARTRYGTQMISQTKDGLESFLIDFQFSSTQAYIIEVSSTGFFRFFKDGARITDLTGVITNVTNSAGLILITDVAHGLSTGNYAYIQGVLGVPAANGEWVVTVVSPDTFTLNGSVFAGTYTSGGTWSRPYQIASVYNTVAICRDLRWAQSADTLYLVHPSFPVNKLTRTGHTNWTLNTITFLDGPYLDQNKTAITLTASATTGAGITITASSALFVASDVGRLIRIFHTATWGYVLITAFGSSTSVTATVINTLGGTTAVTTWRLGAWSTTTGYPAVVTIFEQRLCFAASPAQPQTLWLSTTGSYEDMTPSSTAGVVAASDALTYTLGSNKVNVIRWLIGGTKLFIGTMGEEFTMDGGNAALSAVNPPLVKSNSSEGSSAYALPARVASLILFLQRSQRELRAMKFDLIEDTFQTQEVSIIAEHLFKRPFTGFRMSYQARPDHTVWITRSDGKLLSFTYYPAEKVEGWALHATSGVYYDVNVIPSADLYSDQSWYVTQRAKGDLSLKYYIEMQNFDFNVDSGLQYSGAPATSVTGLAHLEGRTVKIIGDGAVYDDKVVTNGAVALEYGGVAGPAASSIIVGLAFSPNPKIETLRPAYKDTHGTVRSRFKHWVTVFVGLFETMGLTINGKQLQYRKPSDPMDSVEPNFTGEKPIPNLGWSREGMITFEQELPLSATITGYYGDLNVGD